jgi:hypothetical protein
LARRSPALDPVQRIGQIYRRAFARAPSKDEERIGLGFLGDKPAEDDWTRYVQVLLASNEFMFVD